MTTSLYAYARHLRSMSPQPGHDPRGRDPLTARPAVGPERAVQVRLALALGGRIEVPTPVGFIDVLTDAEVIEVKDSSQWMTAAKIVFYGAYFPDRALRVHFFGRTSVGKRSLIENHMSANFPAVKLTWEPS